MTGEPHGRRRQASSWHFGFPLQPLEKNFYLENLPKKKWFFHYAQHFDTVEINNTFYHLPSASAFDAWKAQAPAGFIYAFKFNRYGSHWMRLKNGAATIGNFLDRAARLEGRLGPILVQLHRVGPPTPSA